MPRFYVQICTVDNEVKDFFPGRDVRDSPPSRVAEGLTAARHAAPTHSTSFPWRRLVASDLPAKVRDFQWKRGWGVLATKDRLYRWGVTRNANCPTCGRPENARHLVYDCLVARTFWNLVARFFRIPRLSLYYINGRCPKVPLERLLLAAGELVLWQNRCWADRSGRQARMVFPLVSRLHGAVTCHLEDQFATLGERVFVKKWCGDFVTVERGRPVIRPVVLDPG